jgi:hypothetical protein
VRRNPKEMTSIPQEMRRTPQEEEEKLKRRGETQTDAHMDDSLNRRGIGALTLLMLVQFECTHFLCKIL